jgi:hypothetical protein
MILGRYPKPYLRYIPLLFYQLYTSSAFGTAGRVYLAPVQVPFKCIIDAASYEVGGTSAGSIRIGVYKHTAAYMAPDYCPLVCQSDEVPMGTANRMCIVSLPETVLEPGLYWVAIQGSDATGTFRYAQVYPVDRNNLGGYYFDNPGGFGPYPSVSPFTTRLGICPGIFLRVKDVLI